MCLACEGATLDDMMHVVAEKIHANTVTFVPVEGGGFAYSVGMTAQGMPELYADTKSGFPLDTNPLGPEASIAGGLQQVVDRLLAEGEPPATATRLYEHNEGGSMEIRFRSWSTKNLVIARKFYTGQPITALRVVQQIPPPVRARPALQ